MPDNKEKSTQQTKKIILVKKLAPSTQQSKGLSNNESVDKETKTNNTQTTNNSITATSAPTNSKPTPKTNTSNIEAKNSSIVKPASTLNLPTTTNSSASAAKIVSIVSIVPPTISKPKANTNLTKSTLDLTIKLYEVPKELNTNAQGEKEFFVTANQCQVFLSLKTKQFNKLIEAQEKYPNWIGRISGKLGAFTNDGFILDQPNLQVFEKPAKSLPKTVSPSLDSNVDSNKENNKNKENNVGTSNSLNIFDSSNENHPHPHLPITNKEYKEIVQLFTPFLSKGKLPSKEQINEFLDPYKLSDTTKRQLIGNLVYHHTVDRQTGFLIETLYCKLLETWEKTYKQLIHHIAHTLNLNQKPVERWISFLHSMPSYVAKTPLPEENLINEAQEKYKNYLLSDIFPEQGLHFLIANTSSTKITFHQVHKILATYRKDLRDKFFLKNSQNTKPLNNVDS